MLVSHPGKSFGLKFIPNQLDFWAKYPLNSSGNAKQLARNVFEANFDRWLRKRVSADALS